MTSLRALTFSLPLVLAGGIAQAAVVDFGGLSEGTNMLGAFDFGGGLTGTISSSALGGNATGNVLVCDTKTDGSACRGNDPDLRSDFSAATGSDFDWGLVDFGNALLLEERGGASPNVDDASSGGMITFVFDKTVKLSYVAILDGADNSPDGASIYLDGVLFDTKRGGDDNEYDIVDIGDMWIKSFSIDFAGSGALGEFEAAVVPLPASALLLIGGVGALGALRRRKTG